MAEPAYLEPRRVTSETNEGLLRETLVGMARLSEQFESLSARVTDTARDAREARDAARASAAAASAQDIPARIAELKGMVQAVTVEFRTDLVNTSSRLTTEFRDGLAAHERRLDGVDQRLKSAEVDIDARFKPLENDLQQRAGASGMLGWVSKYAPWLASALAFAAGLITKGPSHG